jgi:two-component system chemotaxis sensor kinase CheA
MLEQSILESAGYQVDVAVSGEDALRRLEEHHYDLLLVDVEMPGMDGFALIEHLRRNPAWRETPAILVTSRESREDRLRGLAIGAQDYVIKGEFDQRRLLRRIGELLA